MLPSWMHRPLVDEVQGESPTYVQAVRLYALEGLGAHDYRVTGRTEQQDAQRDAKQVFAAHARGARGPRRPHRAHEPPHHGLPQPSAFVRRCLRLDETAHALLVTTRRAQEEQRLNASTVTTNFPAMHPTTQKISPSIAIRIREYVRSCGPLMYVDVRRAELTDALCGQSDAAQGVVDGEAIGDATAAA